MAVEEQTPILSEQAMVGLGIATWRYTHPAQHQDIIRGAQNCADTTGQTQFIIGLDGHCYEKVTPNDERWRALGAKSACIGS